MKVREVLQRKNGSEARGQKNLLDAEVATGFTDIYFPEVASLARAGSLWSVSSG